MLLTVGSGVAVQHSNPFQFGRELGTGELVDREKEIQLVRRTVENRGKLFLIGPRRYGKTSILTVVEDQLTAGGAVILRVDVEAYGSSDRLADAILTAATRSFSGSLERVGKRVAQFFGSLRPELTMSPDHSVTASIGLSRTRKEDLPTLVQVLDGVEAMAAGRDEPVALILDEFQFLVGAGQSAERQLRACVQRHRNVAYVFAGSKTHLLGELTGSPLRPFYKLGARHFLGPLPGADFAAFLRSGFEDSGYAVQEPALQAILALADEVPYNVQQLAHTCWEDLRTSEDPVLSEDLVKNALDWLVRSNDPFYTKLWGRLSRQQMRTVYAVIGEEGRGMFSHAVARRYGVPTPTMQSSLAKLVSDGMIREEQEMGTTRYRLEDPFLAHWLALVQPR